LNTPTPVITHTDLPSVTGDGVDMVCLRSMWLPPASGRFHRIAWLVRSMAQSSSEPVFEAVAMFRKIVLPQMMGVEPL
jgi:hypothetical protein